MTFHFGTETQKYSEIFSFLTQSDDEHIKCLKYITDRTWIFQPTVGFFFFFLQIVFQPNLTNLT